MHIIAEIRSDEVVCRHAIVCQIAGEFAVGPNMSDAIHVGWIVRSGHIVKIGEGVVLDRIRIGIRQRDEGTRNIFLVSAP